MQRCVAHHRITSAFKVALNKGEAAVPPTPGPDSLTMANSNLTQILGVQLTGDAETLKDIIADFKGKGWIE